MSRQISPVPAPILADRRATFKLSRRNHRADKTIAAKLENCLASANGNAMQEGVVIKRSVRIAGHATSISLEAEFWHGLCAIAGARQMPVSALVAAIDAGRHGNLSSAIRIFVLDSARNGELTDDIPDVRLGAID
jgi:predicted DNA-binding ribbon-helix-helix protein